MRQPRFCFYYLLQGWNYFGFVSISHRGWNSLVFVFQPSPKDVTAQLVLSVVVILIKGESASVLQMLMWEAPWLSKKEATGNLHSHVQHLEVIMWDDMSYRIRNEEPAR